MGASAYRPLTDTREAKAYAYLLRAAVQTVHVRGLNASRYQLGICFGAPQRLPCDSILCLDLSLPPAKSQQAGLIEHELKTVVASKFSIQELERLSDTVRVVVLPERVLLIVYQKSHCGHGFSYTACIDLVSLEQIDPRIAHHHATLLNSAFAGSSEIDCRGQRVLTGWESGLSSFRSTVN